MNEEMGSKHKTRHHRAQKVRFKKVSVLDIDLRDLIFEKKGIW